MRLSDVIIITLAVALLFGVFYNMVTDETMEEHYTQEKLNLSNRINNDVKNIDSPYYKLSSAITGQENATSDDAIAIQDDLVIASKNDIGLLSIPSAVLKAMKAVFNVFSFKWMNTFLTSVEQILGLETGDLAIFQVIFTIILWVIIFLFVSAILRWLT